MVVWHPCGFVLTRVLEDTIRGGMGPLGSTKVRTPQLMPKELWVRSGHWDTFAGGMFRVEDEGRQTALKPMSCTDHLELFNHGRRSWRNLLVRLREFELCHRNESSGSMHGLMRARGFGQDEPT